MLCLSVRQPWASLIISGYKDVENRTWRPESPPGRILIHAGRAVDYDGAQVILNRLLEVSDGARKLTLGLMGDEERMPKGAIIGSVRVQGFMQGPRTARTSPWYTGPVGWMLTDPVAFQNPVPLVGEPGLFNVSDTLVGGPGTAPRRLPDFDVKMSPE
jgi:hypothetical protein